LSTGGREHSQIKSCSAWSNPVPAAHLSGDAGGANEAAQDAPLV
jgi:hypothetical protein